MALFDILKKRLVKTRQNLGERLRAIFNSHAQIDEDLYNELEEVLISADVGMDATSAILENLREEIRKTGINLNDLAAVQKTLTEVINRILDTAADKKMNLDHKPAVILIVGVNGSGKTTSIAKLAKYYQNRDKRVMLAAADTFRAAAAEQLLEWGLRIDAPVIHQQSGADPAAVAYDAFQSARAKNYDFLIVDTAGRLHNKANLMNELAKIVRVLKKLDQEAPHEVLLVLDATTGQNAIQQARVFREICGVSGMILAKLDGTAKGGAIVPICRELDLPLRFIGIGEKLDDLEIFDPQAFTQAIFQSEPNKL